MFKELTQNLHTLPQDKECFYTHSMKLIIILVSKTDKNCTKEENAKIPNKISANRIHQYIKMILYPKWVFPPGI